MDYYERMIDDYVRMIEFEARMIQKIERRIEVDAKGDADRWLSTYPNLGAMSGGQWLRWHRANIADYLEALAILLGDENVLPDPKAVAADRGAGVRVLDSGAVRRSVGAP